MSNPSGHMRKKVVLGMLAFAGVSAITIGAFQNCAAPLDGGGTLMASVGTSPTPITYDYGNTTITIQNQPISANPDSSGNVTFSTTASTSVTGAILTYQWYRNSVAIAGATNPYYTFAPVAADYGVAYSCKITDGNSTATTNTANVGTTSNTSLATGTILALTTYENRQASTCDPNAAQTQFPTPAVQKSFLAPVTGTYSIVSYVIAPTTYYFAYPQFQLLDYAFNVLQYDNLFQMNGNCCSGQTFYSGNAGFYRDAFQIQLTQGQTYSIAQTYKLRVCGHPFAVTRGVQAVFYQNPITGPNCGVDTVRSLPAASEFTTQTQNGVEYMCFNGSWGPVTRPPN